MCAHPFSRVGVPQASQRVRASRAAPGPPRGPGSAADGLAPRSLSARDRPGVGGPATGRGDGPRARDWPLAGRPSGGRDGPAERHRSEGDVGGRGAAWGPGGRDGRVGRDAEWGGRDRDRRPGDGPAGGYARDERPTVAPAPRRRGLQSIVVREPAGDVEEEGEHRQQGRGGEEERLERRDSHWKVGWGLSARPCGTYNAAAGWCWGPPTAPRGRIGCNN